MNRVKPTRPEIIRDCPDFATAKEGLGYMAQRGWAVVGKTESGAIVLVNAAHEWRALIPENGGWNIERDQRFLLGIVGQAR